MNTARRYFPALRAHMGDWVFYSTLLSLSELASRVEYAKVIHKSEKMSEYIQRALDDGSRAKDIAQYLVRNKDRFFNSLVIAVYGGEPEWHEFEAIKPRTKDLNMRELSYSARHSLGFLSLSGKEQLFALDGQHRLAGVKTALGMVSKLGVRGFEELGAEEVSVILVAHKSNQKADIRRTRKLFTTLNKTAQSVKKNEIIALDEVDVMAITSRWLIEDTDLFAKKRIDIERKQANLPQSDREHLLTLINLYDLLAILFKKLPLTRELPEFGRTRPSDQVLEKYFEAAQTYFDALMKQFPPMRKYLRSDRPGAILRRYRTNNGGHVLFRPVGMLIFVELAAQFVARGDSVARAVSRLRRLPVNLSERPYDGLIWTRRRVQARNRVLVRDLLAYRMGLIVSRQKIAKLKERYAQALGVEKGGVVLPFLSTKNSRR